MMSVYSILMGGFKRASNFSLESDYIFDSEFDLKEYYSNSANIATMHEGLLRVVKVDNEGKQSLWWVVNKNGELEFEKLISFKDISELKEIISNLETLLLQEIEDRKTANDAIWGNEDHTLVDQNLNSLLKLAKAMTALQEDLFNLKEELKAVIGTDSDDIIEYLKTLPYKSLTEIVDVLKSIAGLEFVKDIKGGETSTTDVRIVKEVDKTTIFTKVKLASEAGNDIQCKNDGIYHNVDTEFENGVLTLRVNGNIKLLHNLGLPIIGVHDANYDPNTESLIIEFDLRSGGTKVLRIPFDNLIGEWTIDNTNKVVELEKVRVEGGGPDKLSADVRLSSNKYNILEKDNDTLLVRGTADNIVFEGDLSVQEKINSVEKSQEDFNSNLDELKENVTSNLDTLRKDIVAETERAKAAEESLANKLDNIAIPSSEKINRIVNGIIKEVTQLPLNPKVDDCYLLVTNIDNKVNYGLYKFNGKEWISELVPLGTIISVINDKVYKLNLNGLEHLLDESDITIVTADTTNSIDTVIESEDNIHYLIKSNLKINSELNDNSDVKLVISESGLFAQLIIGEYD